MIYEDLFLKALILTLLIEIPIVAIITKLLFKSKLKIWKIIFIGACASILTLPYVWFIFPKYILDYTAYLIVAELFAFLFETIFYWQTLELRFDKALLISLLANLISFLIGLIIL